MCISHILSLKNTSAVFFLCYPAVFSTAEYCPCYKWVFYGYKWVINGYFVFFYTNVQLRVGEKKKSAAYPWTGFYSFNFIAVVGIQYLNIAWSVLLSNCLTLLETWVGSCSMDRKRFYMNKFPLLKDPWFIFMIKISFDKFCTTSVTNIFLYITYLEYNSI